MQKNTTTGRPGRFASWTFGRRKRPGQLWASE